MLTAAVPRSRKRRRRQGTLADCSPSSPCPTTLPLVAAVANIGPSQSAISTKATQLRLLQSSTGDLDLDAQIAMLSLVQANGYGPIPGTPLIRSKTSRFVERCRTRDLRDSPTSSNLTQSSTVGGSIMRCNTTGGIRSKKYPRGNSSPAREPWMGPMDSGVGSGDLQQASLKEGTSLKALDPVTIEREEFRTTKVQREAAAKGRFLFSQLDRVLHRRDLGAAAQLLKLARAEFRAANDANGISDVDTALIKTKADIVVQAMEVARKARDFNSMQKLMFEALYYSIVLAHLSQGQRHDTSSISERRDSERKAYERFRCPRRRCREYALEDGRKSLKAAATLSRKRKYLEAHSRLEDARLCFKWAGAADADLKVLQRVLEDLEVRENASCGDRLTEGVAKKLQLFTLKDYRVLFSELSEAAKAYEIAHDREGTQVVRLVTAGLTALQSAEQRWLYLFDALEGRKYSIASRHLKDAKCHIIEATRGLPFVNASLSQAAKILSPAGGLSPLDIIAELAALDGLRDHTKSVQALEQGMLDKAQQLNTSARKVFEFTARCCNKPSISSGDSTASSALNSARGDASTNQNDREASTSPAGLKPNSHQYLRRRDHDSKTEPTAEQPRVDEAVATFAAPVTIDSATRGENPLLFSPSAKQLSEGEALLFKIRRSTSASTHADSVSVPSKPRPTVNPGVRYRVEDLLDKVSETEDVITRKKALERGDNLMLLFWDTVASADTPTTTTTTTTTRTITGHRKKLVATNRNNKTVEVEVIGEGDEVLGFCGALSSERVEKCLGLLAEAKEAYEGQEFGQQAESAARLRAEIVADQCLAKASQLAHPAAANATAAGSPSFVMSEAKSPVAEEWCSPWGSYGGLSPSGSFESARAAVREAEENYARAGNSVGVLKAKRTELSLKGDEAMTMVAPLLDRRAYGAALEGLECVRRLYTAAGPQGADGLDRTRNPEGLVKAVALREGERLKAEAVQVLKDRDVEKSTQLCQQAQRCFSFVDREGLSNATANVDAAVHMVTRLASGDAIVVAAEAALVAGASDRAAELLREAKFFYHQAQVSYENLVDQVTSLLEERPDDSDSVRKAMELQDNINGIYDSRRDGERAVKVEKRLDCLAADTSLENLAQVVDHGQFEDAHILLDSAESVYERSKDEGRLSKVNRIMNLVGLVEKAAVAFDESRYADAESLVTDCLRERSALVVEQPLSLHAPDCKLFQCGEGGAKTAVLLRVRAAGDADRVNALELLENREYEAAEVTAASASARFNWWASHGGGNDNGATGGTVDPDDRQTVLSSTKELTAMVAAATGKARAEGLTVEGKALRAMGDFTRAVHALSTAANIFHSVGLVLAATITRADACQIQAESFIQASTISHNEGNFEAISENLQKAEVLLLEAIEIRSTIEEKRGGGNDGMNVDDSLVESTDRSSPADGGAQSDLDDLYNFQSRAAGNVVMRGVLPALDAREYDLALQLMLKADGHFVAIKTGRWMTSAVVTASKDKVGAVAASSKEFVVKRAAQDGDRFRADAATAIQKDKNPVKAKELLSIAEASMTWAGVDIFTAGATVVAKDIKIFESRRSGDDICLGLIHLLRDRELERTKGMLERALDEYRKGDAFKQIADTRAVMFCVEREESLTCDVASAVATSDPIAAFKMLEECRPIFEIAMEMKSVVLQDVAELMGVKHKHIAILITFFRAWAQCIDGVTPTGDSEGTKSPKERMEAVLSDIRAMMASEAPVVDISFDLLLEAYDRVTEAKSKPPLQLIATPVSVSEVALPILSESLLRDNLSGDVVVDAQEQSSGTNFRGGNSSVGTTSGKTGIFENGCVEDSDRFDPDCQGTAGNGKEEGGAMNIETVGGAIVVDETGVVACASEGSARSLSVVPASGKDDGPGADRQAAVNARVIPAEMGVFMDGNIVSNSPLSIAGHQEVVSNVAIINNDDDVQYDVDKAATPSTELDDVSYDLDDDFGDESDEDMSTPASRATVSATADLAGKKLSDKVIFEVSASGSNEEIVACLGEITSKREGEEIYADEESDILTAPKKYDGINSSDRGSARPLCIATRESNDDNADSDGQTVNQGDGLVSDAKTTTSPSVVQTDKGAFDEESKTVSTLILSTLNQEGGPISKATNKDDNVLGINGSPSLSAERESAGSDLYEDFEDESEPELSTSASPTDISVTPRPTSTHGTREGYFRGGEEKVGIGTESTIPASSLGINVVGNQQQSEGEEFYPADIDKLDQEDVHGHSSSENLSCASGSSSNSIGAGRESSSTTRSNRSVAEDSSSISQLLDDESTADSSVDSGGPSGPIQPGRVADSEKPTANTKLTTCADDHDSRYDTNTTNTSGSPYPEKHSGAAENNLGGTTEPQVTGSLVDAAGSRSEVLTQEVVTEESNVPGSRNKVVLNIESHKDPQHEVSSLSSDVNADISIRGPDGIEPAGCTSDDTVGLSDTEEHPGGVIEERSTKKEEWNDSEGECSSVGPDVNDSLPHSAETKTTKPIVTDSYKSTAERVDIMVDVKDPKERFNRVLSSAIDLPGSPPSAQDARAPVTAGQSLLPLEDYGTLLEKNEGEPTNVPWPPLTASPLQREDPSYYETEDDGPEEDGRLNTSLDYNDDGQDQAQHSPLMHAATNASTYNEEGEANLGLTALGAMGQQAEGHTSYLEEQDKADNKNVDTFRGQISETTGGEVNQGQVGAQSGLRHDDSVVATFDVEKGDVNLLGGAENSATDEGLVGNHVAAPSSADVVAQPVVNEGDVAVRKQREESGDLYDIDNIELSSDSDDD